MSIENNKYKDYINDILEDYFENITTKTLDESLDEYDFVDTELDEVLRYGLSQLNETLSEEEFNQLRPGDFVIVKQFQSDFDLATARHVARPFLITHIIGDKAFGFTCTTIEPEERYSLEYLKIEDYEACGLLKPGYLELEMCKFHKRFFIRDKDADGNIRVGHITPELKNKLIARMQQISSTKTWLDNLSYYPGKIIKDVDEM